jgi:chromosome segregation ATPase
MTDRRTLTWQACDALATTGKKPSIGSVREWTLATTGAKRGSDTDVQADVNAWYQELLKLRHTAVAIPHLPDPIAALARELWVKANEAAADALAAERDTIAAQVAAAHEVAAAAESRATAANARAEATTHELDVARESIRHLEVALSQLRATIEATAARHADQLEARDERIAALTDDFARREREYATRIAELDGVRKHALLQIDEARTESRHWKTEFHRIDAENTRTVARYQQSAASLEADLAGARGRLSAVEEALAASRQRCSQLEGEWALAKAESPAAAMALAPKRARAGKLRAASVLVHRRKL